MKTIDEKKVSWWIGPALLCLLTGAIIGWRLYAVTRPCPHFATIAVVDLIEPSDSTVECEFLWRAEVSRRFSDAVMVFCHGNQINGVWCIVPAEGKPVPVQTFAEQMARDFSGHPVVLVTCNPAHAKIHVRGVYYANDVVVMRPDKSGNLAFMICPEAVGNVFEFVETP